MTDPSVLGALDGVRIVDLTQMLAGPYCTMLLADQGAEVIKVEPLDGDHTRIIGPYHVDDRLKAFGGYFASVNRNKKSIAIDLKTEAGRDLVLKLCDNADAVVENYRGGVMDRLGLSYETLHARNPKLVYATIRGFGDVRTGKSPYSDFPAYDVISQAMGGIMAITGPDKDTPMKVGPGVGDIVPAITCAFGIVSAILRAYKTGRGQFVDVGMVDAILAVCERIMHQHSYAQTLPHPEGNHHPLLCPFGMFPAKDGFVTIAAHADAHFPILCRLIDRAEFATDPRFITVQDRRANQDVLIATVSDFTRQRTKQELLKHFGGKVPFSPVYNVRDIVADPHFKARDMLPWVPHPGLDHEVQIAGVAVKMTETPGKVRHRAPLLGEHTDEYLKTIGLGTGDIARLRADKIVA
ncbi:CoA transferase [Reyranella sp.]|uniref:CaiB/BaiF CoA transferase family protein n=1 Tax=Reyranella sp. TaxID=1929291 RepID=UPI000BC4F03A|nr:CoA transferase [Reyranella sp.]OYY44187.1 MAG: CoA transferase [Rhodospirillales bacterium 35-66-84]OYZ94863.1 MAG: CoA transferase [Rhodospirillales bacterium 24-66-33]OZB26062.1 MAG: CoA transferase [Rhodospirillales bacterium 39-66-50]HQS15244.1 CoA transferase [Reyranella sp.]HQT11053.1 CoA transferase [Reyranella sp.]